ncbi:amino acid synthesis family protein, partial [Mesorhizobium sp. M7A.F.Ca.US.014.04.1.1]
MEIRKVCTFIDAVLIEGGKVAGKP